ncbi:MAG: dihydropteroate synthase [Acidimicrobiales bacterium]|nr:dihydropteroate synthase [Acidimicrobiales bacterium]
MGIVNVTPDSFSDGGRFLDADAAIEHGRAMLADGAAWLDVGGESSRPGAEPVSSEIELERVIPVVEALANDGLVSIDTVKPEVARAAVAAGATMINDISASLASVAGELGVAWVAMHCQGTPRTMQDAPRYDDVVAEVTADLAAAIEAGQAAGVSQIYVDPGIGFGKTTQHNLTLLAHLDRFVALGFPVLVGASRKRFIGEIHSRADHRSEPGSQLAAIDDRLEGSLAVATWASAQGAAIVRVHDVRATVQAVRVVAA